MYGVEADVIYKSSVSPLDELCLYSQLKVSPVNLLFEHQLLASYSSHEMMEK